MHRPVRLRAAALAGLVAVLASTAAPASAQTDPAGSGTLRPPVLVTGDSLSHQAAEDIAEALAADGYHDVDFAVFGGTTIGWATDRVLERDAPIVVFASGTYSAVDGWTAADEAEALRAVDVLGQRRCAVWVLPAAARYPDGILQAHPQSRDTVAAIRRIVSGTAAVHLAEWDLVADARREIHISDGVHLTDGGQDIYASLVAGSVRHRCEDADPARTEPQARYATWAHVTLLGRQPGPAEGTAWTDRLAGGHDRLAFARHLAGSAEWAGAQVDDLYRRALGREADASGRAYWRDLLVGGAPFDVVAANVFGSDEAFHRSGATPTDFVTALYRQLLQREPDRPGLEFWLGKMAGGTPRPVVAAAFHRSPESRGDRVDHLYRSILGREPDPTGRAAWVGALAVVNDLHLAALLAASDEAFRRAQVG